MQVRFSWRGLARRSSPRTRAFTKRPGPRSFPRRGNYHPLIEELRPRQLMTGGPGAVARALAADLPADIAPVARNLLTSSHIPGMGVAITYGGTVVLEQGYGVLGDKARAPVTASTTFQIGSVTKTFTAIAVLMIAENPALIDKLANPGIASLRLDAPLGTYLPEGVPISLPSLAGGQTFTLPPQWANLTPRQLLDMSSGLPDDLSHTPWNIVIENLIRHRKTHPVFSPPGSRYLYSDLGFQLLGGLIEKLTNQSYAEFVEQHILAPLGMTESTVLTGSQTSVPGQAVGFATYNPRNNRGTLPSGGAFSGAAAYSAAAIVASAVDLGKYMSALWNESSALLSTASYQEMWTPVALPSQKNRKTTVTAGLGWDGVATSPAGATVWKTGNVPGYQSEIELFRDDGVGVAVAFNLNNPSSRGAHVTAQRVVAEIHAAVDAALAAVP
jgi:D-alanyl-D-alanine carboxypeptidase